MDARQTACQPQAQPVSTRMATIDHRRGRVTRVNEKMKAGGGLLVRERRIGEWERVRFNMNEAESDSMLMGTNGDSV